MNYQDGCLLCFLEKAHCLLLILTLHIYSSSDFSCGWSPGLGLGPRNAGRRETVSIELEEVVGAQTSNEKKGLGYRGEKLQRTGFVKRKSHKMATKYILHYGSQISDVIHWYRVESYKFCSDCYKSSD